MKRPTLFVLYACSHLDKLHVFLSDTFQLKCVFNKYWGRLNMLLETEPTGHKTAVWTCFCSKEQSAHSTGLPGTLRFDFDPENVLKSGPGSFLRLKTRGFHVQTGRRSFPVNWSLFSSSCHTFLCIFRVKHIMQLVWVGQTKKTGLKLIFEHNDFVFRWHVSLFQCMILLLSITLVVNKHNS